jgi:hypothetical protein
MARPKSVILNARYFTSAIRCAFAGIALRTKMKGINLFSLLDPRKNAE